MAIHILFLVRHGQYDGSTDQGDGLEGGLSALGRRQAELTGERLKGIPFTTIYHSPLRRAAETAAIIARSLPGIPMEPDPLLRECIPGVPERDPQVFDSTPEDLIVAGLAQAVEAFARFFRRAYGPDRRDLLVCHGNIIRFFACRALGAPTELWANADIFNCSLSEVLVEPSGRLTLTSLNDTGHLPQELRT